MKKRVVILNDELGTMALGFSKAGYDIGALSPLRSFAVGRAYGAEVERRKGEGRAEVLWRWNEDMVC